MYALAWFIDLLPHFMLSLLLLTTFFSILLIRCTVVNAASSSSSSSPNSLVVTVETWSTSSSTCISNGSSTAVSNTTSSLVRLGRWCINTCFLKKDFLINDGWAWTTSFWNSCYHVAVNFSSFKSSNELSDSMEGIPRHQSIWLSLQLLEHNQRAQKTNHHWQWKWTRRMACLLIQLQQWMSIILAAISRFSGLSSDLGSGRAGRMDFTMSESVVLQEHSHNLHRPLQILSS